MGAGLRAALAACAILASAGTAMAQSPEGCGDTPPAQPGVYTFQDPAYPQLRDDGQVQDFVPAGWRVEARAEGPMAGFPVGEARGVVLVLRCEAARNILNDTTGLGETARFDTNPRILVLLMEVSEGRYQRLLDDHFLIPRPTDLSRADPFGGVAMADGQLKLTLRHALAKNSGVEIRVTYGFAFDGLAVVLKRFERREANAVTGETQDLSVDYAGHRMTTVTTNSRTAESRTETADLPADLAFEFHQVVRGDHERSETGRLGGPSLWRLPRLRLTH